MKITNEQWQKILTIVVSAFLAVFAVLGWLPSTGLPGAPAEGRSVERIGVLCAAEGGNCVEGWNGSGIALYSDAGSTQTFGVNGSTGALTFAGALSQSSTLAMTLVNAASGSANPFDYTGTLGIMNGSDTFELFDINMTNADHTGGTNVVRVMDIANITGDAQAQENAFNIGSGWDVDVNGTTSLEFGVDNTVVLTLADPAAADSAATTNGANVAYTTPADTTGTNLHNGVNVALTIGNASGGTNTISAVNVANVTGDAQSTEYGLNVGTGFDRGINVAGGGAVIVGTVTVDTGEIGAAEVADVTRSVTLPLHSFIECSTDAGTAIGFDTTADALPDFANSSTDGLGFTLTFDATGGSPDTTRVCASITVPPDYVSGGAIVARATKGAETGANTEVLNCAGSINGAALGTAGTVTVSGTASAAYTCTPTLTSLAAGNSVAITLYITSGGTADDAVNLASVEFQYTATQ